MIRRGPTLTAAGYWTPISGRLEPGESQQDTVIREAHEEMGATVIPLDKVWECPTHNGQFTLHWYRARLVAGGTTQCTVEVDGYQWVTPNEFGRLQPTFPDDARFFREILPTLPPPPVIGGNR